MNSRQFLSVREQQNYWERESLNNRRTPQHPIVSEYVERTLRRMNSYISLPTKSTLLDVGCGDGRFTFHLSRLFSTMGVDYSHKLLTHNAESKLARMDALNMGFEDESFDVVFCSALLHHIEDVDKAIREFVRISRRYLVLVEPNALNPLMALFSCLVPEERGTLRFTPRYLKKRIQREGLHILANYSYGFDMPNRWPVSCLQIVRLLGFRHLLGTSRIIVAEKNTNTPRN